MVYSGAFEDADEMAGLAQMTAEILVAVAIRAYTLSTGCYRKPQSAYEMYTTRRGRQQSFAFADKLQLCQREKNGLASRVVCLEIVPGALVSSVMKLVAAEASNHAGNK